MKNPRKELEEVKEAEIQMKTKQMEDEKALNQLLVVD
jgi:hypothetical protein